MAAVNHFSSLDPPVAGLALRRPVRFLAVDEVWGVYPALDVVLKLFDAIPVSRTTRRAFAALTEAIRHLESGHPIGVFVEGTRVANWGDRPLKAGAAWLAVRAAVPVVPVAIWGSQHAMSMDEMKVRRAPIRVVVGEPIYLGPFIEQPDPVPALSGAIHSVLDEEIRLLERTHPARKRRE